MSDINNRVLYVLQVKHDKDKQMVYVTTLSQFLLPNPFLSYHILEAKSRQTSPYSYSNSIEDLYGDERDDFEEDCDMTVISLKMLVIQPKKLQDCNITFQPEKLLMNTTSLFNDITEIDLVEKVSKVSNSEQKSSNAYLRSSNKSQLNLMTPEDFTTNSRPNSLHNSLTNEVTIDNSDTTKFDESGVENLIDFQGSQKEVFASGGSSPSREVQEILSLNNSSYSPQDYFDNLPKLKDDAEQPQKDFNDVNETLIYDVGNEMVWPKIPVLKDDELVKDVNDVNEIDKTHLQSINFRISSLENTIREQNILMQKLQSDIKELTQICSRTNSNKEEFVRELDCAMSKQQLQIAKVLENLINIQKNNERELHEQIVSSIGQLLSKTLSDNIKMIISYEMKHVVIPSIRSLVDSYKHQTDAQYLQKLNNAELTLRESIAKALNSKVSAFPEQYLISPVLSHILKILK